MASIRARGERSTTVRQNELNEEGHRRFHSQDTRVRAREGNSIGESNLPRWYDQPSFFPSLPIPSLLVSIVPRSLLMALLMANMIFRSIRSTKTVGPIRKGWINTINVIYSAMSGTITRSFSGFSDCLILHRNWFDYWFFFFGILWWHLIHFCL